LGLKGDTIGMILLTPNQAATLRDRFLPDFTTVQKMCAD
jgi:hypothetical protein